MNYLGLGQSGARVSLVETNGATLIRKEVTDDNQRARLERQFVKHQMAFREDLMGPIRVPQLLKHWDGNGYDMEYVPGVPLGSALSTISQTEVGNISSLITDYFQKNSDLVDSNTINNPALVKIETLQQTYASRELALDPVLGATALKILKSYFEAETCHSSPNHGDFSLDNLLRVSSSVYTVNAKREILYAIDFLDSPFDSILIDIGRLWVDLSTIWWAHSEHPSPSGWTNSQLLRVLVGRSVRAMGIDMRQVLIFAVFASLRILPYTVRPSRKAIIQGFLRKAVQEL